MSARSLAVVALLVLTGPALAQTNHAGHGSGMAMGGMDPGLMAAMEQMNKSMPEKSAGSVDADFVKMMIPHHQAAIDMAKVELAKGTDTEQRKLAEEIIKAQEKEIGEMKAWLKAKGIQ
jgi:uncharacterized protein (DUF305 family)